MNLIEIIVGCTVGASIAVLLTQRDIIRRMNRRITNEIKRDGDHDHE